jgi:hypothetical protein
MAYVRRDGTNRFHRCEEQLRAFLESEGKLYIDLAWPQDSGCKKILDKACDSTRARSGGFDEGFVAALAVGVQVAKELGLGTAERVEEEMHGSCPCERILQLVHQRGETSSCVLYGERDDNDNDYDCGSIRIGSLGIESPPNPPFNNRFLFQQPEKGKNAEPSRMHARKHEWPATAARNRT